MPASATYELAGLYSSTHTRVRPKLIDNTFKITPALAVMKARNRVEMQRGGTHVSCRLEYEENPTIQWINIQTGAIDTTRSDPITTNLEEWALVGGSVYALHDVAAHNTGEAQIANLQRDYVNNTKKTMAQALETAIFGEQSGSSPYGLKDLCDTDPTSGTIGKIDRATYSWYRNGYKDMTSLPMATNGETWMRTAYLSVMEWGNPQDLTIFTDSATWGLYADIVGERHQISSTRDGDIGFPNLAYMGAPMYWSPKAPSGEMRFLDLGYYKLWINSVVNFDLGEWIPAQDNINLLAHLMTEAQMMVSRPASGYVLFNVS